MAEKTRKYTFQLRLNESESRRFEAYANLTGIKKYVIVHKALFEYLDENEPTPEAQK